MFGLVSNSELLPRWSCWNPARTDGPSPLSHALHSCLWGWTKSEVYKRKVDTRDELPARILHAPARIKESEDQPRRAKAIFAHEMQSALSFAVVIFLHLL